MDGEGDQVGDELLGAGRQAADQQAGGIGHVVEHADAVAEILRVGRQAAGGHRGLVELHIGPISSQAPGCRKPLSSNGSQRTEQRKLPIAWQVHDRPGLATHGPTA